jgi:hypothetical protein
VRMHLATRVDDRPGSVTTALDDQRLVENAARVIGVPRREVVDGRFSFVLHAPLELLARAALLPHVLPGHRDRARQRIVALVEGYEASGPPLDPPEPVTFGSTMEAATALAAAVEAGDLSDVDVAAAWLGDRAGPGELVRLLSGTFLDRLSAAGHGNIYLAQLSRTQPRGLPGQMLRHPAQALALDSARRIRVPETTTRDDPDGSLAEALLDAAQRVTPIGPPPSDFIAPLVEHAQDSGAFDNLVGADGVFVAPRRTPHTMLRFAAHTMLQGSPDQAPYGWTHCLTLAQAPLLLADAGGAPGPASYVASAYLAAHWAGLGHGSVDLEHVPASVDADLAEALLDDPATSAGAAWHTDDPSRAASLLATAASINHDAHRVKYTLACLDAAACDPAATRLYLAAAAHLNAWWNAHPHADDESPSPLLG